MEDLFFGIFTESGFKEGAYFSLLVDFSASIPTKLDFSKLQLWFSFPF